VEFFMKLRTLFLSVILIAGSTAGFSGTAYADSSAASPTAGANGNSVLTIDGKQVDLGADPAAVRPNGQPAGQVVPCGTTNTFIDGNGTYTIQHACGAATASWGYRISAADCATAEGTVNEAGQIWSLNGVSKPKQAPHPGVLCTYTFHGT
jgi:hypothetical protein